MVRAVERVVRTLSMKLRTVTAIAAVGIVPMFVFHFLPIQDYPNVLAIVATLGRHDTPGFARFFREDWSFGPYTAFYALTYALSRVVGPDPAVRIAMGIPMVAIPAALSNLGRRLTAGGELAGLLVIPLLFTELYFVGFHPFLWSMLFAILAAIALEAHLRAANDRLAMAIAAFFALAWLAHPSAPVMVVATTGVVLATRPLDRRRLVSAASAVVPLLVAASVYASRNPSLDARAGGLEVPLVDELRYDAMLPAFPVDSFAGSPRGAGTAVATLFGAIVVWRGVVALLSHAIRARAWLVPLALFGASVVLPFGAGAIVWLDTRVMIAAYVAALLLGASTIRRAVLERVAVALVLVPIAAAVFAEHRTFEHECQPLDALFARVPDDSVVLGAAFSKSDEAFVPAYVRDRTVPTFSLFTHFVARFHERHGGISPSMTFHPSLGWIPLRFRDPRLGLRFPITSPFAPVRVIRSLAADTAGIEYVFVRRIRPDQRAQLAPIATEVASSGRFTLFRITRASPPR